MKCPAHFSVEAQGFRNHLTPASAGALTGCLCRYRVPGHKQVNFMLTIGEWLLTLPEDADIRAINNCECLGVSHAGDLRQVLEDAFYWENSPEGILYWRSVYDRLS